MTQGNQQFIAFRLGGCDCGINIGQIREINRLVEISKMPGTPSFIEGVINLRGEVIPVLDLLKLFEMGESVTTPDSRILVAEVNGKTIGCIVDSVNEVLRVNRIEELPDLLLQTGDHRFVTEVAKLGDRLILILDLDKILANYDELLQTVGNPVSR
ncbi:MAG: chemotaxis protein CheW [Firmicutes bacterium]|nr:chemotaxis protein CheW [Bacillota bacterium]